MKQIERIYITKGDNSYNHAGVKSDKACAIQIDGRLYWINQSFAHLRELESEFRTLGVIFSCDYKKFGVHSVTEEWTSLNKNITRIPHHHDDIFSDKSGYIKRAERSPKGAYWWYVEDILGDLGGDLSNRL